MASQGIEPVVVNVDFNELQVRVNQLRGQATNVLHKTKEKLEDVAAKAGLPVTINVHASIVFHEKNDSGNKTKD